MGKSKNKELKKFARFDNVLWYDMKKLKKEIWMHAYAFAMKVF
jgi:hypothetical protein